jgi:hypothetical protein
MVLFDVQKIEKLDAAIQQVEAAIELFYAKKYAPAITLAAAAEGCLPRKSGAKADREPPPPEPLFVLMKRGAKGRIGKDEGEAVERFNRVTYWLKHETLHLPISMEITNYEAFWMIVRALSRIEFTAPGSGTPAIARFIEFSRAHYLAIPGR